MLRPVRQSLFRLQVLTHKRQSVILPKIFALLFCALSGQARGNTLQKSDFHVSAKILHMMEGGPFVIRVTLHYSGREPTEVHTHAFSPAAWIEAPKHWKRAIRPNLTLFVGNFDGGAQRLKTGDKWHEVHYLHQEFLDVPSGITQLIVKWEVRDYFQRADEKERSNLQSERKVIATPSTTINVDIPKATPERARNLAKQFQLSLKQHLSEKEVRHIVDCIRYTRHRAFAAVARGLIQNCKHPYFVLDLIDFIYNRTRDPRETNRFLLDVVLSKSSPPQHIVDTFHYWWVKEWQAKINYLADGIPQSPHGLRIAITERLRCPSLLTHDLQHLCNHFRARKRLLTDDQLQELSSAKNLWVCVLTWTSFSDRCDKTWILKLKRKLRELYRPLSQEELRHLIAQLDSQKYTERENASKELRRHGERVTDELKKVLANKSSFEVRARIKAILREIKQQPLGPFVERVIHHVAWQARNGGPSLEILQILAEGAGGYQLVQKARAALTKIDKEKTKKE